MNTERMGIWWYRTHILRAEPDGESRWRDRRILWTNELPKEPGSNGICVIIDEEPLETLEFRAREKALSFLKSRGVHV